jgi:hypothetical protein
VKYLCFLLCLTAQAQLIAALKPETLQDFAAYEVTVDQEFQQRVRGQRAFLWIDEHPDKKRQAEAGQVVTCAITGTDGRSVTSGLIHDWMGDVYLRGVRLDAVRKLLLETERHSTIYAPEVRSAKVLSRDANHSITLLRFVKKKYLTVTLDMEYRNDWQQPSPDTWVMDSRSLKVTEIDNGKPLPPDTGHGFMWRMNSEWYLRQDAGGTWVELRSLTLSRDTPRGLGWILRPLIRNFPAETILATLEATRRALQ